MQNNSGPYYDLSVRLSGGFIIFLYDNGGSSWKPPFIAQIITFPHQRPTEGDLWNGSEPAR